MRAHATEVSAEPSTPLASKADKESRSAFIQSSRGPCRPPLLPEGIFPAVCLLLLLWPRTPLESILVEVAVSEVSLCTERLSSLRAGQHPGRPSKCPCPCMPNAAGACLVKAHILSMHAPQIIRDSPLCVCCVPFSRDDCPAYFSLLSVGPRLCWTSPRPVYFSPTSTRRPNATAAT